MTTPEINDAPAEFVVRPRDTLAPGSVLGDRYRIVRAVAAGGFGAVYEARHIRTERRVAVKVLHAWLSDDPKTRERFRRELQAPAQIKHPGIVEVLDADVDPDGVPFLVMDWLEGETLRARMKRGRLSLAEVKAIFVPFLGALDAAHGAGFVHRDLKPENCMLVRDADGTRRPCLVDFGLARKTGARSVTVTGTALGTPRYMSPEQFMNAKLVGPESDIWAVGAMMYEALAGEPPFDAKISHALMLQILMEPPTPILTKIPELPPRLAALIERCLDKEPGRRPSDAAALRAQLLDIYAELPGGGAATTPGLPQFPSPTAAPPGQREGLSHAVTELAMRTLPRPPEADAMDTLARTTPIATVAPHPTRGAEATASPPRESNTATASPPLSPRPASKMRPAASAPGTRRDLRHEPVRARPNFAAPGGRSSKHWWLLAALGLLLAVGAAGVAATLWSLRHTERPRPRPHAPRQAAPPREPMSPLPLPTPGRTPDTTPEAPDDGERDEPMAPAGTNPSRGPMDPITGPLERWLLE